MMASVNVYSTDIRFAYIAEQKLHGDGYPVTRIEEWYEDGEQIGYHVYGSEREPIVLDEGMNEEVLGPVMPDGGEHQGSRRVGDSIPDEPVALLNFRRNVWGFVAGLVALILLVACWVGLVAIARWLIP